MVQILGTMLKGCEEDNLVNISFVVELVNLALGSGLGRHQKDLLISHQNEQHTSCLLAAIPLCFLSKSVIFKIRVMRHRELDRAFWTLGISSHIFHGCTVSSQSLSIKITQTPSIDCFNMVLMADYLDIIRP